MSPPWLSCACPNKSPTGYESLFPSFARSKCSGWRERPPAASRLSPFARGTILILPLAKGESRGGGRGRSRHPLNNSSKLLRSSLRGSYAPSSSGGAIRSSLRGSISVIHVVVEAAGAHGFGQLLEQVDAVLPSDAGIGDALAIDEIFAGQQVLP